LVLASGLSQINGVPEDVFDFLCIDVNSCLLNSIQSGSVP